MTIDEAIATLKEDIDSTGCAELGEIAEAEKLGIEALKRLRGMRLHEQWNPSEMLSGETEE